MCFGKSLDVQAHIVTWIYESDTLAMLLHSERFASARVRRSVGGQADLIPTWLGNTLFHSASEHITNTHHLVEWVH